MINTINIIGCARCGYAHYDLETKPLTNPPEREGVIETRWAICPETQEPITVYVTDQVYVDSEDG